MVEQKQSLMEMIEKIEEEKAIAASDQLEINKIALQRKLEPREISAINRLTQLIEKGQIQVQ